jgi:hypothetical protein
MATNGFQERSGRETRLLALIVIVSLGVLLVLARFRFPAATLSVAPPVPTPLSNLASRAAFRDLSDAIVTAYDAISPRVVVVRLDEAAPPAAPPARGKSAEPPPAPPATRLAAAVRVRPDVAVLAVPEGFRVGRVAGMEPQGVAADQGRALTVVRVPPRPDARLDAGVEGFTGFSFVIQVTATETGPSVQPIFIGRTGAREDARWPSGVVAVDHATVPEGAFLFTLEGRFLGMVIRTGAVAAIVPPSAIEHAAAALIAAAGAGS